MTAKTSEKPDPAPRVLNTSGTPSEDTPDVLVCVDVGETWKRAIHHAQAVAASFGGNVVLIKVFEPPNPLVAPVDPVDWQIRKRSVRSELDKLAKDYATPECAVKIKTFEGNLIDQLCACAKRNPQDITVVLGNGGTNGWTVRHRIGRLADFDIGSVLMIPPNIDLSAPPKFDRIFVPLDGSRLAESAIPMAVSMAKAHNSELFICHITPDAGITVIGPSDEAVLALQEQIQQRNRRTGKGYLKRISAKLKDSGIPVSTVFIDGGDVRRSLLGAARKHAADLLVLASHGQSGQTDVPTGHITSYILDHSTIPVLMVRKQHLSEEGHAFSDVRSSGVRVPTNKNNG